MRPSPWLAGAISGLLVGTLARCEFTLSDPSSNAVLDVAVRRESDDPVAGASLHVRVVDSARRHTVIDDVIGVTDGAGRLRRVLGAFLWPSFRGQVALMIRPSASTGLPDSAVAAGVVQFRMEPDPPDTLRLVITYP